MICIFLNLCPPLPLVLPVGAGLIFIGFLSHFYSPPIPPSCLLLLPRGAGFPASAPFASHPQLLFLLSCLCLFRERPGISGALFPRAGFSLPGCLPPGLVLLLLVLFCSLAAASYFSYGPYMSGLSASIPLLRAPVAPSLPCCSALLVFLSWSLRWSLKTFSPPRPGLDLPTARTEAVFRACALDRSATPPPPEDDMYTC